MGARGCAAEGTATTSEASTPATTAPRAAGENFWFGENGRNVSTSWPSDSFQAALNLRPVFSDPVTIG